MLVLRGRVPERGVKDSRELALMRDRQAVAVATRGGAATSVDGEGHAAPATRASLEAMMRSPRADGDTDLRGRTGRVRSRALRTEDDSCHDGAKNVGRRATVVGRPTTARNRGI
jgi:hypothetical protein